MVTKLQNKSKTTNTQEEVLITQELDKYKMDNSSMKQLFQSMKEISAWLSGQEK